MTITKDIFGMHEGNPIERFTLKNDNGMTVRAINYGCIITEVVVPDKDGNYENVVLGFDNIDDYKNYSPYFGAIVGRVAGRIANGKFTLNGIEYTLPENEGRNHLHGNSEFNNALWCANGFCDEKNKLAGVTFTYGSPDGKNGYPGNVDVCVTYTLDNCNELKISYEATTDTETILNLTNHSYFNLSGNMRRTVCNHILTSDIDSYAELRDDLLPTGNLKKVEGTTFDFTRSYAVSEGVNSDDKQNITAGNGYDHALVFNDCKAENLATLKDPESGRIMTMKTDYPCFVLYTGNQLDGSFKINGIPVMKYAALCMEAQYLPDAPNFPHFGDISLKPNEVYKRFTSYTFAV